MQFILRYLKFPIIKIKYFLNHALCLIMLKTKQQFLKHKFNEYYQEQLVFKKKKVQMHLMLVYACQVH